MNSNKNENDSKQNTSEEKAEVAIEDTSINKITEKVENIEISYDNVINNSDETGKTNNINNEGKHIKNTPITNNNIINQNKMPTIENSKSYNNNINTEQTEKNNVSSNENETSETNIEVEDNNIENGNSGKGKNKESEEETQTNAKTGDKEKPSTSDVSNKNEEVITNNKSKLHNKEEDIYKLKIIEKRNDYQGITQQKNIITQNINGPCPLLALCNILILRGDISISLKKTEITYEEIIDILGDYIARSAGNNNDSDEYNFQDVLDTIPTLKKGLDINVKFDSVQSFEPSPALTVFKYFNINLVHGWTVDPEDKETYRIIVNECGNYNTVVEKIIESDSVNTSKENINEENEEEKNKRENIYYTGMVCKNFIESSATQLTLHGLASIPYVLSVGEPTAFFRNNHFLTLIKTSDNTLYTLVTDQGFVNERKIVWESLTRVDGDSYFVDGLFNRYDERSIMNDQENLMLNSPNEDLDYAIALSLQEDEEKKRDEMLERNARRMNSNQKNIHYQNGHGHSGRSHGHGHGDGHRHNSNSNYNNNSNSNGRRKSSYSNSNSNNNSNINKSKSKENDEDKCILM
ncbi:DUF544-domain-containing protein [Neocallimastix lanati (nom. inval.)]|jgi:hypothetical protein|nr:DUF544-domain-containing protein [Neocallimastix sp. JGI-2020a]